MTHRLTRQLQTPDKTWEADMSCLPCIPSNREVVGGSRQMKHEDQKRLLTESGFSLGCMTNKEPEAAVVQSHLPHSTFKIRCTFTV